MLKNTVSIKVEHDQFWIQIKSSHGLSKVAMNVLRTQKNIMSLHFIQNEIRFCEKCSPKKHYPVITQMETFGQEPVPSGKINLFISHLPGI